MAETELKTEAQAEAPAAVAEKAPAKKAVANKPGSKGYFYALGRRADLLGRDPREKERKKFGLKGARKQRQFTKR